VLDAGCGSRRVTEQLAERLARGHVIALDGSPSMVEAARARLAWFGDRVRYVVADLGAPLPLEVASVDAVLSTATFHWVPDHAALFRHLATVLRPGGRLVAQCGGAGNIRAIRAAIAAADEPWAGPWTFATPDETRARLSAAGFTDIEAWLHDEPTALEPGAPLRDYLRTVVLGAHLDRLPPGRRDAFVDAVADGMGTLEIDYVRLNILATRG
jgi:trans-aconitate 2-methyltransferase